MKPSLVLTLFISLVGCGDDDRSGSDASSDAARSCMADSDCDDSIECTLDSCGVSGTCRYDELDELCPGEQICETGRGCVDEPTCTVDADCDDSIECTFDTCGVDGCRNTSLDERCSGAGPGSTCDPATGMSGTGCTAPTGCTGDGDCDDGVDCTLDSCGLDSMCRHDALDERCDTGELCTPTGCFTPMPCETDDECQDDNFCNGREFCEPEFGCRPAPEPRVCNDSDDCTTDSCNTDLDMCVFACDSSAPGCDCPDTTPCNGVFDIAPAPAQRCADSILFMDPPQVDYNVSEVEFTCVGDLLQVDGRNIPKSTRNVPLTQVPRPSDGSFDVLVEVGGGCVEGYRLQGRFTDADTFTATWTAMYTNTDPILDMCAVSGCMNQSIMVTGTRR